MGNYLAKKTKWAGEISGFEVVFCIFFRPERENFDISICGCSWWMDRLSEVVSVAMAMPAGGPRYIFLCRYHELYYHKLNACGYFEVSFLV